MEGWEGALGFPPWKYEKFNDESTASADASVGGAKAT